jgi:hypothetical protein
MSLADTKFEREPGGSIVVRNSPDGYNLTLSEPAADAAVRRANSDPLVHLLSRASSDWTAPAVLRQYKNDEVGHAAFAKEVSIFGQHNYTPMTQSADGGHIHVGRLLLTGGWSVFAGKSGIRSDGTITVTFQKAPVGPAISPNPESQPPQSAALETLAVLEKMGQLRDAGVLTQEEFETKKAELLSRL